MTVYDIVAFFGILLEIVGFIFLLKYSREPDSFDYDTWVEKIRKKFSEEKYIKMVTDYEENNLNIRSRTENKYARPFVKSWRTNRNIGIYLVIGGLFGQLIQVWFSLFV